MLALSKEIIIEGTIENIIFNNPDNGYTVFSINVTEAKDVDETEVICVAYIADACEGENIVLTGSFIMHPSYGMQFNAKSYKKKEPSSLDGIEKYLASGIIRGIRQRLAAKIVARFREDTLKILEEAPEMLAEIRGINLEKALEIGQIFKEHSEKRNVIIALQNYGISPAYSAKIYEKYKDLTIETIKQNPYILAEEITGIGFKIADSIAMKLGFSKEDPLRISSGIKYVLMQAAANGHTCLPKDIFIEQAGEMLEAGAEFIENSLILLQMERHICLEKISGIDTVFLNGYYYCESYVAKKLIELSRQKTVISFDIEKELAKIEEATDIKLAEQQRNAVTAAIESGILVITGGPGTGKTTIINTIIKLLRLGGFNIELAAPTGRAAKRITETTGFDAKTIHRLLGVSFGDDNDRNQVYDKNEDNPLDTDALIIDESSMVDILLMFNLLKAVTIGTKVIFVGDADQLPSVGPGNVLRDIISSGTIQTIHLDEIFRQDQESAIIVNAHRINHGEYPYLNEKNKDFFLVRRSNVNDVAETIKELIKTRLPSAYGIDSKKDIQLLSPMRKSQIGVLNLNAELQKSLNPPSNNKNERQRLDTVFRENDKVIQIKNNYKLNWRIMKNGRVSDEGQGIYNGDEGIIKSIDNSSETMTIIFDENRHVIYDFSQIDELELSYAITVHKSQGSEYNTVVIPVHSGPPMLMSRNILYTAITRAKRLVVLVGTEEALKRMIDNRREVERYSALSHRLKKIAMIEDEI